MKPLREFVNGVICGLIKRQLRDAEIIVVDGDTGPPYLPAFRGRVRNVVARPAIGGTEFVVVCIEPGGLTNALQIDSHRIPYQDLEHEKGTNLWLYRR